MKSSNVTQLIITRVTTPQALIGRHGFPSNFRKFLHARGAEVSPSNDFNRRTCRAGFSCSIKKHILDLSQYFDSQLLMLFKGRCLHDS